MSASDVDRFFQTYVFGFMFGDVQREIDLARQSPRRGGGNYLAALGLLCFLGGVQRGTLANRNSAKNFNAFFHELGPEYAALLARGFNAYRLLRCGMAHEYLVKGTATVAMLKGNEPCGVGELADGRRYFVIERYFEDFAGAAPEAALGSGRPAWSATTPTDRRTLVPR